ncbi:unnamed protein product [Linum tenue]|uniref:Uncharacterized protein n=1 Tax=Linum tenue TaxID=586396 RepID=A0AAV0K9X2_9ROSI|nr:unnamed protein product [Linum tenue]
MNDKRGYSYSSKFQQYYCDHYICMGEDDLFSLPRALVDSETQDEGHRLLLKPQQKMIFKLFFLFSLL